MVEWNNEMENILEKRRIKIEKIKMKMFNFLSKIATARKI